MSRMALIGMAVVTLALAPVASSTSVSSGLRGKVTLFPARPVCIEGDPCTKPASGAVVVFSRDDRIAARVTTGKEGWYRVPLAPGRYTVTAPAYRRGSGVTPKTVRVPKGRITRVDLQIDTGIQ